MKKRFWASLLSLSLLLTLLPAPARAAERDERDAGAATVSLQKPGGSTSSLTMPYIDITDCDEYKDDDGNISFKYYISISSKSFFSTHVEPNANVEPYSGKWKSRQDAESFTATIPAEIFSEYLTVDWDGVLISNTSAYEKKTSDADGGIVLQGKYGSNYVTAFGSYSNVTVRVPVTLPADRFEAAAAYGALELDGTAVISNSQLGADSDLRYTISHSITVEDPNNRRGSLEVDGPDGDTPAFDGASGAWVLEGPGSYTFSGTAADFESIRIAGSKIELNLDGVDIDCGDNRKPAISIEPDSSAEIILFGDNTIEGGPGCAGIYVAPGAELTISGKGTLDVTGGGSTIYTDAEITGDPKRDIYVAGGAGIGGNGYSFWESGSVVQLMLPSFGTVIIEDGTVNATGGIWKDPGWGKVNNVGAGAGIGAGGTSSQGGLDGVPDGTVIISGGEVTATGGDTESDSLTGGGAGIGAGGATGDWFLPYNNLVQVTIRGGTVTAAGTADGAGIGGGANVDGGVISITGGEVTATGGYEIEDGRQSGGYGGAGIGGGDNGGVTSISITGGTVVAEAVGAAAGIGAGNLGFVGDFIYDEDKGTKEPRQGEILIGGTADVTAYGGSHVDGKRGGAGIGAGRSESYANNGCGAIALSGNAAVKAYAGTSAQAIGVGSRYVESDPNSLIIDDTVTLWAQNRDTALPALLDKTAYHSAANYLVFSTDTQNQATGYLDLPGNDGGTVLSYALEDNSLTIDGTEIPAAEPEAPVGSWATLYSKPTPRYNVVYDLQGGTEAPGVDYDGPFTFEEGETVTVLAAPAREGFLFDGWNTAADGSGTVYWPDDTFSIAGDTTLTAQWIDTAITYTVTYDLGTGNPAGNRTVVVHGGDPAPEITPDGWEDHVFAGWYADQEKTEPYDFTAPITKNVTIYAKWKQLKYTLRYGDGRPNDGEWGYHYAEGQTGYYVPGRPKPLPSEVRHFTEIDVNNPIYPGVTAAGWYFLSWMRFAEISEADIDPSRDVYVKNGDGWEELRDWRGSGETLYQYIAEGQTPDTDCGDVDYFAQWVLIQIDVEVDIEVGVSISGIGETHALVAIDDSQRSALAKNVNLPTDVRDSNTEIKITAYVRNASSDAEIAALTARLDGQYSYGSNRIDYDVSVEKEITSDGRTEITALKTLAEPIEIVFAVPDQWQGRGTVSMFRAHTDAGAAAVEKLPDLDNNAATYTIESDKFSTYAMIYVPAPVGPVGPGGPGGGGDDYCTLHYASNGGTRYKDERYAKNTVVQLDKAPVREGYQFTGWYADADLTQRITSIRMTGDRTVYAGWRKSAVPDMLNGDDHFAYVVGYADGTVRPDANISRAEVAAIFFRLLKPEIREDNLTGLSTFADVSEGMWYNKSVATMAKLGIVKGRPAGTFDPDEPITRGEFAAICARFDAGMTDGDSSFTDISGHWAEAEIEHAASLGWIMGYSDGAFRPDSYITRAEAITMINRVLCRIPENESDLLPGMRVWPDNQPGTWYYLAVQEAANSHSFQYKGEIYEYWIRLIADPDWTRYQD